MPRTPGHTLPLVRAAHAQDKVVAATADIRVTARGLLPATVRAAPDHFGPGGLLGWVVAAPSAYNTGGRLRK